MAKFLILLNSLQLSHFLNGLLPPPHGKKSTVAWFASSQRSDLKYPVTLCNRTCLAGKSIYRWFSPFKPPFSAGLITDFPCFSPWCSNMFLYFPMIFLHFPCFSITNHLNYNHFDRQTQRLPSGRSTHFGGDNVQGEGLTTLASFGQSHYGNI